MKSLECIRQMSELGICVLIPTYNNEKTLAPVIESVCDYCNSVYVISDGSNDSTNSILEKYKQQVDVITYQPNRGKGYAIKQGFKQARKTGFRYAITVDSDGQHYADDLPIFVKAITNNPDAFIIGSRSFDNKNMPGKSKFANKFSNFWFRLQTAKNIADTQTGYRLYPIRRMGKMLPLTNRYEAELELLVRSAWRGIKLVPIPIKVFYPKKEERVSHFRPSKDFTRISLLNTVLCLLAIVYGYPSMIIHKLIGR